VPAFVFSLPPEQIMVLLTALIHGDGRCGGTHWDGSRSATFHSSSKALADDVQRLALHVGLRASVRMYAPHVAWCVQMCRPRKESRRLQAPTWVPYDGKVFCFSVPTGTLVTRRNGCVLISGNSHRESGDVAARLYDEATDLGLNVVVDGTGDAEPGEFLADLRRARQGGYEVEVVYVNRSTEESIALAIRRAEEEGRWVPLPVLRAQHAAVSRNFRDEISLQDWLTINVYDAEGHVAAITHGRADIFNRGRFEEFIVKAEED
jgi:hypothetical protein